MARPRHAVLDARLIDEVRDDAPRHARRDLAHIERRDGREHLVRARVFGARDDVNPPRLVQRRPADVVRSFVDAPSELAVQRASRPHMNIYAAPQRLRIRRHDVLGCLPIPPHVHHGKGGMVLAGRLHGHLEQPRKRERPVPVLLRGVAPGHDIPDFQTFVKPQQGHDGVCKDLRKRARIALGAFAPRKQHVDALLQGVVALFVHKNVEVVVEHVDTLDRIYALLVRIAHVHGELQDRRRGSRAILKAERLDGQARAHAINAVIHAQDAEQVRHALVHDHFLPRVAEHVPRDDRIERRAHAAVLPDAGHARGNPGVLGRCTDVVVLEAVGEERVLRGLAFEYPGVRHAAGISLERQLEERGQPDRRFGVRSRPLSTELRRLAQLGFRDDGRALGERLERNPVRAEHAGKRVLRRAVRRRAERESGRCHGRRSLRLESVAVFPRVVQARVVDAPQLARPLEDDELHHDVHLDAARDHVVRQRTVRMSRLEADVVRKIARPAQADGGHAREPDAHRNLELDGDRAGDLRLRVVEVPVLEHQGALGDHAYLPGDLRRGGRAHLGEHRHGTHDGRRRDRPAHRELEDDAACPLPQAGVEQVLHDAIELDSHVELELMRELVFLHGGAVGLHARLHVLVFLQVVPCVIDDLLVLLLDGFGGLLLPVAAFEEVRLVLELQHRLPAHADHEHARRAGRNEQRHRRERQGDRGAANRRRPGGGHRVAQPAGHRAECLFQARIRRIDRVERRFDDLCLRAAAIPIRAVVRLEAKAEGAVDRKRLVACGRQVGPLERKRAPSVRQFERLLFSYGGNAVFVHGRQLHTRTRCSRSAQDTGHDVRLGVRHRTEKLVLRVQDVPAVEADPFEVGFVRAFQLARGHLNARAAVDAQATDAESAVAVSCLHEDLAVEALALALPAVVDLGRDVRDVDDDRAVGIGRARGGRAVAGLECHLRARHGRFGVAGHVDDLEAHVVERHDEHRDLARFVLACGVGIPAVVRPHGRHEEQQRACGASRQERAARDGDAGLIVLAVFRVGEVVSSSHSGPLGVKRNTRGGAKRSACGIRPSAMSRRHGRHITRWAPCASRLPSSIPRSPHRRHTHFARKMGVLRGRKRRRATTKGAPAIGGALR